LGVEVENTHRQTKVAIGPFELDLNAHQLRRQGRLLRLQELPLRLLTVLVEAPGELVTHERLEKELWGDTVVNFDDGLHTAVRELREALGDSATTPRFIPTVARKGYRFIAPLTPCNGLKQRPRPTNRWRRARILSALALLTLALAAAWFWVRAYVTGSIDVPTVSDVVPLTSYPGTQRSPSLSPDGRKFAFAWTGFTGDNLDIYVQDVDNGTPTRLTSDPAADDYPAWSPDGSRIAFIRSGIVYFVPSGGGKERELARAAGPGLDWSPDGSLLAVSDRESKDEPTGIFVVSVATGQPIGELAWTPDDRFVIFGAQQGLLRVPFHSSSPQTYVGPLGHAPGLEDEGRRQRADPAHHERRLSGLRVAGRQECTLLEGAPAAWHLERSGRRRQ
jgi:DNA-binding winged helix-turn-helix (wHTH) protein